MNTEQPGELDQRREEAEKRLREALKTQAEPLRTLFVSTNDERGYEDTIYRFYHQSFKVFLLQESTLQIVEALKALLPGYPLNPWFLQIVNEGTGKVFKQEDNNQWLTATRPILEAYFHARFFLEMACRYVDARPGPTLPSGWAGLLYLYQLR